MPSFNIRIALIISQQIPTAKLTRRTTGIGNPALVILIVNTDAKPITPTKDKSNEPANIIVDKPRAGINT